MIHKIDSKRVKNFLKNFNKSNLFCRCEDNPQICERKAQIWRTDCYHGTFWCWKVDVAQYFNRIQVTICFILILNKIFVTKNMNKKGVIQFQLNFCTPSNQNICYNSDKLKSYWKLWAKLFASIIIWTYYHRKREGWKYLSAWFNKQSQGKMKCNNRYQ